MILDDDRGKDFNDACKGSVALGKMLKPRMNLLRIHMHASSSIGKNYKKLYSLTKRDGETSECKRERIEREKENAKRKESIMSEKARAKFYGWHHKIKEVIGEDLIEKMVESEYKTSLKNVNFFEKLAKENPTIKHQIIDLACHIALVNTLNMFMNLDDNEMGLILGLKTAMAAINLDKEF